MPVVQQGAINTTALQVPDLYVQIVPPQTQYLNGVATNILGIVGTASWGPVNSPTTAGDLSQAAAIFGPVANRKHDLCTAVALAVLQGSANFRLVRVTDGTDTAATASVQTNCLTLTSKYTGSFGNSIAVQLAAGSQTGTWKAIVSASGLLPELFDNLGAGLTGAALWAAIASAINNGASIVRGPSAIIVATAGSGTATPTAASFTLSGGTDGAGTITGTTLTGQDTTPRTGMYALRNTGTSIAMLADCDDSTSWSTQVAFGLSEGVYMIGTGPSGDTISNAVSVKALAGIDSYAFRLLHGDWIYWQDAYNNTLRLVSPQACIAGKLAALSPEQSTLNKEILGIVGTQRSYSGTVYSSAELQQLGAAGIDVICNPVPGGSYFGARFGRNSSSNAMVHGDNYTRMTNYIAYTLNAGMGRFVGLLQGVRNTKTRDQAKATLDAFLLNLRDQNMIDDFSVVCDSSNNPASRIALGYMQADCKVRYLGVVEYFIVNMEGGQSVTVTHAGTTAAAA